ALRQLVGEGDRGGHQFGVLVHREAEHHALVTGPAGVHTHGNIAGLLVDAGNHGAGVAVETVERVVVANRLDHAAHQRLKVHIRLGCNFSRDDDQSGGGQSFAGNAAGTVFGQAGVENGIGNLVSDLIRVAFGH